MNWSATYLPSILLGLLLAGVQGATSALADERMVYEVMEPQGRNKLPLAPHVLRLRARPTEAMLRESQGTPLRFVSLDKRTLQVINLEAAVGERREMPWGGWLKPLAYVADLIIRDGQSLHGLEGHVNPAVWIQLEDRQGKIMHEGWLFVRDTAQTAWDHPRFDLTFAGAIPKPTPEPAGAAPGKSTPPAKGSGKPAATTKSTPAATGSGTASPTAAPVAPSKPAAVAPPKPAAETVSPPVGSGSVGKSSTIVPIPPRPAAGSSGATGSAPLTRPSVSESAPPPVSRDR